MALMVAPPLTPTVRSIKIELTVTLLLAILLPTALIAVIAYWFVKAISENRMNDVQRVADERYQ